MARNRIHFQKGLRKPRQRPQLSGADTILLRAKQLTTWLNPAVIGLRHPLTISWR